MRERKKIAEPAGNIGQTPREIAFTLAGMGNDAGRGRNAFGRVHRHLRKDGCNAVLHGREQSRMACVL